MSRIVNYIMTRIIALQLARMVAYILNIVTDITMFLVVGYIMTRMITLIMSRIED
jgi:hypothetical protein